MNIIESIQQSFNAFLEKQYGIDISANKECLITINTDEHKQQFGDLNSSAALTLSKQLKKSPRQIAQDIVDNFHHTHLLKVEIAGPGFLNFFIAPASAAQLAQELFIQKNNFFKPHTFNAQKINIEFVSANPTGPLHFGHGRGGIIGDVLSNVLTFIGHHVTKEFYINDAGAQIQKLGNSLKIRYLQAAGMDVNLPEDAYHGEYLIDVANVLHTQHGNTLLNQPELFFSSYAKEQLLLLIKGTLNDYGINFDVWFSEKTLHDSGQVKQSISHLEKRGHLFEDDGALWFRSTDFNDDKDRVLRKKNGELTYAAADIAYMENKINRGYDQLIYILGHDHHSYATRLQGLLKALGHTTALNVILYQLVQLKKGDEQVRMSKRAGNIVSLQDIIDVAGKDVARYFYLNRKADAQLEFDLALALSHSDENPAYYIQYAYVRIGSIIQKAAHYHEFKDINTNDLKDLSAEDIFLLKKICSLHEILMAINFNHQTHILAYYTHELAQVFNRYYAKNRVIEHENIPQTRTRLALVTIVRQSLELCLDLLGLSKPEKM